MHPVSRISVNFWQFSEAAFVILSLFDPGKGKKNRSRIRDELRNHFRGYNPGSTSINLKFYVVDLGSGIEKFGMGWEKHKAKFIDFIIDLILNGMLLGKF